ncbi:MAG: VWA domain-containing protein [Myxococcales bacterium]|nr:VWA domain-containing protein [Myxococcales bacterium]
MNRTGLFLAAAGVLALVAVVAAVPRMHGGTTTTTPSTTVTTPIDPATASDGSLSMTARLSHPFVGLGRQDVFLTVDLRAVEVPGAQRAPVNLAMVIDRSGSMSGFKLNQAKQAARQLVGQLNASDRLSIVHYGSDVKSMDGLMATPENKARLLAFIDGIWDDGGTNIGAGLAAGRDLLLSTKSDFRVNRLVLISDGQPTEGVTDFGGLTGIVRDIRGTGVSVSSIGVGDDFNENLMEALAEVGAGAYAYLQDASQLASIFQKDLNAAGTQVARGVALTFKVPQGARLQRVLGYSQVARAFDGATELVTVSMPDFAAAQQERVVVHLTVDAAQAGRTVSVSDLDLTYTDLLKGSAVKSEAHLAAMTTDQADMVVKNQDKDAVVFAARARAADNSRKAAELLGDGDLEGAKALFKTNEAIFGEAAAVAGAPAVAPDIAAQQAQAEAFDQARDEPAKKAAQKAVRTKARIDYGLMGSTY